jgi:hypothetical protein
LLCKETGPSRTCVAMTSYCITLYATRNKQRTLHYIIARREGAGADRCSTYKEQVLSTADSRCLQRVLLHDILFPRRLARDRADALVDPPAQAHLPGRGPASTNPTIPAAAVPDVHHVVALRESDQVLPVERPEQHGRHVPPLLLLPPPFASPEPGPEREVPLPLCFAPCMAACAYGCPPPPRCRSRARACTIVGVG